MNINMPNPQESPIAPSPILLSPPASAPLSGALPRARELFKAAYKVLVQKPKLFFGIALLAVLATAISAFVVAALVAFMFYRGQITSYFPFFSLLAISLILFLLALVLANIIFQFWANVALICAVKDRNEQIGLKSAFRQAWPKLASFVWISVLTGLCVLGGMLLLIVPGIIFAIWFCFSSYVLIDEGLKGRQALRKSKQLIKGRTGKIFWRLLFVGVIYLLAVLLFSLLSAILKAPGIETAGNWLIQFAFAPFLIIYNYLLYEAAKQTQPVN